jgi:hypothetical protein
MPENRRCNKCRWLVDEGGYLMLHRKEISNLAYDWYNLGLRRMRGKSIGPCRGCHEVETYMTLKMLNLLVLLGVLKEFNFGSKTIG